MYGFLIYTLLLVLTFIYHSELWIQIPFAAMRAVPTYCGWAADRIRAQLLAEIAALFGLS
jgi:hypothetical protein